ncbi:TonB-dependent siderophore receptor [Planctobacterium marinum]|uniref:Ligand-gated channel protein n=1 Tax=Planctobacterium marinum TaxID=1631968 RepID=A0AA48HR69_9ALTE|nr:ligand-gated channel protein [Planctobacterium marinum]
MKRLPLSPVFIAVSFATAALAEDAAIETIEVKGSYIEGYGAHDASGASKLDLSILEIPQSVSVITAAQVNDFQLNSINQVLDTATGVHVERIETDRTYYTARGFNISNFQVDGVGLPLTRDNNHGEMDTAIYERVEVIRGANGIMTGVGNPSATVNFIRKRPGAHNSLDSTVTLGSWNSQRLELDGTYHLTDTLAARAVVVEQRNESYLDRYDKDKAAYYLFLQQQIGENSTLSLSHSINDSQTDSVIWGANPLYYTDGTATDFDQAINTSADWSYWNIRQSDTVLELKHYFANDWQLRATYSHKSTNEDTELFYVYGTPERETGLGLTGYASEYDNDDKHNLFDMFLTGGFSLWGQEHEFVVGINHSTMDFAETSLYDYENGFPAMPSLLNWDGITDLNGNTIAPVYDDGLTGSDVEREQRAVYFSTRLHLSEQFTALLGGRQNDWQVTGDSYGASQNTDDDEFIPYLGLVYDVTDNTMVYASYTETFLGQTELDINNQPLKPITGESKELGIKSQLFSDKLIASFAWFDVVQNNVAVTDPATADLPPTEQRYIGVEGISSDGFEFEIAGEVLPGLQTSLGYTSYGIEGDEQVKAYTPEKLFKVAATYSLPQVEGLIIGANYRWQDDISRIQGVVADGFDNAGQTIVTRQDAYGVLDLMLRYEVNEQLAVTLNANNVADEKYLNSLYWAQGYYGAPANYSATLTYKL